MKVLELEKRESKFYEYVSFVYDGEVLHSVKRRKGGKISSDIDNFLNRNNFVECSETGVIVKAEDCYNVGGCLVSIPYAEDYCGQDVYGDWYFLDDLVYIDDELYHKDSDEICWLEDEECWALKCDSYQTYDKDFNWVWSSEEYGVEDTDTAFCSYEARELNCYYCDVYDGWFEYEYNMPSNMYVADYHSDVSPHFAEDIESGFSFGVEIEKEDVYVKESCVLSEIPTGWRKERDSSLDDHSGFEFITPVYDLYSDRLANDIMDSYILKSHINADYSKSCGGHFNVKCEGMTSAEFATQLEGWYPLFYSLYYGRINTSYTQAKKKKAYLSADKYSAINLKDGGIVEIRIFSAVSNVDTLLWRIELMRIICKNLSLSENAVFMMLLNPRSEIRKHLSKVYSKEKILRKIELFAKYSEEFNDAVVSK